MTDETNNNSTKKKHSRPNGGSENSRKFSQRKDGERQSSRKGGGRRGNRRWHRPKKSTEHSDVKAQNSTSEIEQTSVEKPAEQPSPEVLQETKERSVEQVDAVEMPSSIDEPADSAPQTEEESKEAETHVVGITIRCKRGVFTVDDSEDWNVGDEVIVKTSRGKEYGVVHTPVLPSHVNRDKELALLGIVRAANPNDVKTEKKNREKEKKALKAATRKIELLKLQMRLVHVEYLFDSSRIIFYFVAPQKVDFRELVKVLASEFRTRIELRQINPREHVALFGAVGQCGRSSCCCAHLARPPMIEIAMVENQRLGKNPAKLNGVCGRLKCCLKYENDFYTEEYAGIPPRNTLVECPDGRRGYICSANIFLKTVTIRHEEGGCAEYDFDTVRKMSPVDKKNRNNGQNNKNQNNSSSEG